jgi:hypothetical protein
MTPVDVEELLVQGLLRQNTGVTDLIDTRVYTRRPPNPRYPLVTVRRVTGHLVYSHGPWLDRAWIEYQVWSENIKTEGATKKATERIASAVRVALIEGQSQSYSPLGWIDGIVELQGPREVPDGLGERFRYVGEMSVLVRPSAEAS